MSLILSESLCDMIEIFHYAAIAQHCFTRSSLSEFFRQNKFSVLNTLAHIHTAHHSNIMQIKVWIPLNEIKLLKDLFTFFFVSLFLSFFSFSWNPAALNYKMRLSLSEWVAVFKIKKRLMFKCHFGRFLYFPFGCVYKYLKEAISHETDAQEGTDCINKATINMSRRKLLLRRQKDTIKS